MLYGEGEREVSSSTLPHVKFHNQNEIGSGSSQTDQVLERAASGGLFIDISRSFPLVHVPAPQGRKHRNYNGDLLHLLAGWTSFQIRDRRHRCGCTWLITLPDFLADAMKKAGLRLKAKHAGKDPKNGDTEENVQYLLQVFSDFTTCLKPSPDHTPSNTAVFQASWDIPFEMPKEGGPSNDKGKQKGRNAKRARPPSPESTTAST